MFGKPIFKRYSSIINVISRISDPTVIVIAAIIAYGIRFSFDSVLFMHKDYKVLVALSLFSSVFIFQAFGLYSSWRGQGFIRQVNTIIMAWAVVVFILIAILFMLKISSDYSRLWLSIWAALALLLIIVNRMLVYLFLQYQRKKGLNLRNVVLVGAGELGKKVIAQIKSSPWTGYKIDALFDDNKLLLGSSIDDVRVEGNLFSVADYLASNDIDEVWIALPLRAEMRVKELLFELRHNTVNIKFIPDIFGFSLLNHSMTEIAGLPAVNLSDTPMGGSNRVVKELEDRILGLIILIAILPLICIIALAIRVTSPGPVLFKQRRHGWDGRVINIYKFRTMKVEDDGDGKVLQATRDDPRLTKIGGFLRKTSLDELPQLYNVLQGRMSLVGPRPHAVEHNELYKDKVDQYMLRHMVKPGMTGWAQVNGFRGETDTLYKMQKRIEYDLFYIENWSLWFDLKIILLTIIKGFINKNAY